MSDQQKVIHNYLIALLKDVSDEEMASLPHVDKDEEMAERPQMSALPRYDETKPEPEPESITQVKTIGLEELVAEIPDVNVEKETITESKKEAKINVEEVTVTEKPHVELEAKIEDAPKPEAVVKRVAHNEQGVPVWGESDFQCLLFKVSGLTLAVPLIKLSSVIPWSENLVETPNQTDWYLGLVKHLDHNVKVIDTAMMVLPENRHADLEADPADRFSHILLVDNGRWGLACDTIGDVIWLSTDKVKWRKDKTKRAWLAGTALEQLCAVMDTEVFADMLNAKTTA